MDDERVRDVLEKAVSEGYGQGFLDKIIQVPLHVPPPAQDAMIDAVVAQLKDAFDAIGWELPQELTSKDYYQPKELEVLVSLIRTPRDLARYINGLRTLLLAGHDPDVHPIDAVLIEALRIFYPDVYARVRRHKTFLTGQSNLLYYSGIARAEELEKERNKRSAEFDLLVRGDVSPLRPKVEESVRTLLGLLFNNVADPGNRAREGDASKRRIRSFEFFDNYFRYAPPVGAVTRRDVEKVLAGIIEHAKQKSENAIALNLAEAFYGRDDSAMGRMAMDLGHGLQSVTPPLLEQIGRGLLAAVGVLPQDIIIRLLRDVLNAVVGYQEIHINEQLRKSAENLPRELLRMALGSRLSLELLCDLVRKAATSWIVKGQFQELSDELLQRIDQELQVGSLFEKKEDVTARLGRVVYPAIRLRIMAGNLSQGSQLESLQRHLVEFIESHPELLPYALCLAARDTHGGPVLLPPVNSLEETCEPLQSVFGDYKRLRPVYVKYQEEKLNVGNYRRLLDDFGQLLDSSSSIKQPE